MASAPDPTDAKYLPGAEQTRQDIGVGVSVAMTFIGVTCVALRVYTRAFIVRKMGAEDWTMVAAGILTIVFLLQLIAGSKEFKIGFSGMNLTEAQMAGTIKMILAIIVTYKMTMTLIKLSILMIYLKIAVNKTFERLCKITMGLLMAWQVCVIIIVPAQCTPLRKLWDFTGLVEGHCINANAFYHATSSFHIAMDLWILVLPLKLIMRIPRPSRDKIALFIIFGLGIISTIASIIRLQSLRVFTLSNDPFYDSLPINTWSMVEVNIGILCASIPTLKPLVSKAQRHRTQHALRKYDNRKNDGGEWAGEDKAPMLKTGKDMIISLHPATFNGGVKTVDQEWELNDRPPPPPPKDDQYEARSPAASLREGVRYPEKAAQWI